MGTLTVDNLNLAGTSVTQVGKVLQVVSVTKTDTFSTSSNTFVDITGLSASITPSNSSNKILVQGMISVGSPNTGTSQFVIDRGGTDIFKGDSLGGTRRQTTTGENSHGSSTIANACIIGLDSPSSTSSLTYKIQMGVGGGGTHYIGRSVNNTDGGTEVGSSICTLTLTEIGA